MVSITEDDLLNDPSLQETMMVSNILLFVLNISSFSEAASMYPARCHAGQDDGDRVDRTDIGVHGTGSRGPSRDGRDLLLLLEICLLIFRPIPTFSA